MDSKVWYLLRWLSKAENASNECLCCAISATFPRRLYMSSSWNLYSHCVMAADLDLLSWSSRYVEECTVVQYVPVYGWPVGCKKDVSFWIDSVGRAMGPYIGTMHSRNDIAGRLGVAQEHFGWRVRSWLLHDRRLWIHMWHTFPPKAGVLGSIATLLYELFAGFQNLEAQL